MKSKTLIFIFLLTTMSCFSQIKQLTFEFTPTYNEHSQELTEKTQVLIENINSIYTMTITNSKINETHYLSESLVAELNQILADYPQRKATEDSLSTVRIDNELQKRIKGLYVVSNSNGIGVRLAITDSNGSKTFNLNDPIKNTIDDTFIKLMFKLMNQPFWDYQTDTYVEKLEGYFNFGLGVKKRDNSNYTLYGWISYKDEKELNELFDQLPSDIPLYFNMQNFEGMDTTLYKAFKSLCDRNPKITWSGCSDKVKQQFKEAGIVNLTPMGYSIYQY